MNSDITGIKITLYVEYVITFKNNIRFNRRHIQDMYEGHVFIFLPALLAFCHLFQKQNPSQLKLAFPLKY